MKIYFRNRAARLKHLDEGYSCKRCLFFKPIVLCPWNTSINIDCYGKGHWIDGEFIDIFRL